MLRGAFDKSSLSRLGRAVRKLEGKSPLLSVRGQCMCSRGKDVCTFKFGASSGFLRTKDAIGCGVHLMYDTRCSTK